MEGHLRSCLLAALFAGVACDASDSGSPKGDAAVDASGVANDAATDASDDPPPNAIDASQDASATHDAATDDARVADGASDSQDAAHDAAGDDEDAAADAGCTDAIAVQHLASDVLIVLDRSGSMASALTTFPPNFTTKWTMVSDALEATLADHDLAIRFGLLEFPTNDDCAVDTGTAVRVAIDLDQASDVESYFASGAPNGNSPIALGLEAALTHYQSLAVNPGGRSVVLITDGVPACTTDPPMDTLDAVGALATEGIETYVLGFGEDASFLDEAALAGLVPRPGGPPHHYSATDTSALTTVLDGILDDLAEPCRFALAEEPDDADDLRVTANGSVIPRSTGHTDGWDLVDATTLRFYGDACDAITASPATVVEVAAGCGS